MAGWFSFIIPSFTSLTMPWKEKKKGKEMTGRFHWPNLRVPHAAALIARVTIHKKHWLFCHLQWILQVQLSKYVEVHSVKEWSIGTCSVERCHATITRKTTVKAIDLFKLHWSKSKNTVGLTINFQSNLPRGQMAFRIHLPWWIFACPKMALLVDWKRWVLLVKKLKIRDGNNVGDQSGKCDGHRWG